MSSPVKIYGPAHLVEVAKLKGYKHNSRVHPATQIAELMRAIEKFGFTQPLLIEPDETLIAGHGRLEAAAALGMSHVPCVVVDGLTPAQLRALRISDNALALLSTWNDEALRIELEDLQLETFDLSLTGLGSTEIEALLGFKPASGAADPDEAPEAEETAISVLGDLWTLGRHRLVCGSSTDAETVKALLGGEAPHLMVTDPPYGVSYDAAWRGKAKSKDGKRASLGVHAKGKVENDERADWREAWALFPGAVAYVWHAGVHAPEVAESLAASDFQIRSQIIWVKNNFAIGRGNFHWKHEPCWYGVRNGKTAHWEGDHKQTTVWEIPKLQRSETGHSTQKPVECMKRPIELNSKPGDLVYEPFSGSGTTIIAGEITGRSVRAIELNPAYVDLAVKRWQTFTGKSAQHSSGKSFAEITAERAP